VFSCGKKDKVPEGILSRDQMVSVMSELYILEQKVSTLGIKRDSIAGIFRELSERTFDSVGVSDSVFRHSLSYYMDRPAVMEIIYTSLVDSLNLREQRVRSGQIK
jgi:Domain of unknown function (DUF4296)